MAQSPRMRSGEGRAAESRAAEREAHITEHNPFFGVQASHLPDIPEIEGFAVKWVSTDPKNLVKHTNGLLRWEYITPQECPELAGLAQRSPAFAPEISVIRIDDVVAMKAPRRMREMFLQAKHMEAKAMVPRHTAALKSLRNDSLGMRFDVEDSETSAEVGIKPAD